MFEIDDIPDEVFEQVTTGAIIEFNADGTGTSADGEDAQKTPFNWSVDGNKLKITDEDGTVDFTIKSIGDTTADIYIDALPFMLEEMKSNEAFDMIISFLEENITAVGSDLKFTRL
jgi:hypothetical protein